LSETPVHPAATLILVRERQAAAPELLMIQRSATMSFGAGAWVFPGGRVDPGDVALAAMMLPEGASLEDYAARIAAIRETIEEAGVAVGLEPPPGAPALAEIRAALHAGEAFASILGRFALALAPETLLPFSRWQPPHGAPRRFDTRFYIARAPAPVPADAAIEPDGGETVAICWSAPHAMLALDAGRIMFPTACNLRRIAAQPSFDDLAADAALFPNSFVIPEIREFDAARFLCVPDGHGYGDMRLALEKAFRA
jgi:8-oxo-dGTP pyrophosphatase MutT (NUDIX family)